MLLRILHETRLSYSEPVTENVFEVRMAPPSLEDQTALGYRLKITPPTQATSFRDGFSNQVELFNVLAPHREVQVRAMSYVRVHRRPGETRLAEVVWPGEYPPPIEAAEFLHASPLVDPCPALDEFRASLPALSGSLADVACTLMAAVRQRLTYEPRVTTAWTPVSGVLKLNRGVCQDFAHLFLAVCRGVGLPARYVSGYVNQPGETATHAWCQVWGGSRAGWVDLDPTRGTFLAADHVMIGLGRDFSDVAPNRGVWKGNAEETITVTVKVDQVERVPSDWSDLGRPVFPAGGYSQVQRGVRNGSNGQLAVKSRALLRQQQSQQQQ